MASTEKEAPKLTQGGIFGANVKVLISFTYNEPTNPHTALSRPHRSLRNADSPHTDDGGHSKQSPTTWLEGGLLGCRNFSLNITQHLREMRKYCENKGERTITKREAAQRTMTTQVLEIKDMAAKMREKTLWKLQDKVARIL